MGRRRWSPGSECRGITEGHLASAGQGGDTCIALRRARPVGQFVTGPALRLRRNILRWWYLRTTRDSHYLAINPAGAIGVVCGVGCGAGCAPVHPPSTSHAAPGQKFRSSGRTRVTIKCVL